MGRFPADGVDILRGMTERQEEINNRGGLGGGGATLGGTLVALGSSACCWFSAFCSLFSGRVREVPIGPGRLLFRLPHGVAPRFRIGSCCDLWICRMP